MAEKTFREQGVILNPLRRISVHREPFDRRTPCSGKMAGMCNLRHVYELLIVFQVYDRKEGVPAIMQHAGVISSLTSPDTGTYVPAGHEPPTGLTEKDM